MEFQVDRDALLKPLQMVSGVVDRRHSQAILSNVLLQTNSHRLVITGSDLEVELLAHLTLNEPATVGEITVPAKKFIDICKGLAPGSMIKISTNEQQLLIRSGRSRFVLHTLDAKDYPCLDEFSGELEFNLSSQDLLYLIEKTHFSMAQSDVRYYLNGLFLDVSLGKVRAVATDGHRLALAEIPHEEVAQDYAVIVPRKGIIELMRLLANDAMVKVTLTRNHIRISAEGYRFTSKLIDGRFPEYQCVIPKDCQTKITVDKDDLRDTLQRVAILSNEKNRGVSFQVSENSVCLLANNPEQEEAQEELEISYQGDPFEAGFNVSYLIDVLTNLPSGEVVLEMTDAKSSMKVQSVADPSCTYVVMPMRV
jgi:DNA polymerase III subunit beta